MLGNIAVSRDFSDVRDTVNAYSLLLRSDVRSGVFNICSGRPTSLREVLDTLETLTRHHIEIEIDDALIRPDDPEVLVGDPARLAQAVGYEARIPLNDTLRWMLAG
jgi:nucleoside-diphosphate-sugar epimerase